MAELIATSKVADATLVLAKAKWILAQVEEKIAHKKLEALTLKDGNAQVEVDLMHAKLDNANVNSTSAEYSLSKSIELKEKAKVASDEAEKYFETQKDIPLLKQNQGKNQRKVDRDDKLRADIAKNTTATANLHSAEDTLKQATEYLVTAKTNLETAATYKRDIGLQKQAAQTAVETAKITVQNAEKFVKTSRTARDVALRHVQHAFETKPIPHITGTTVAEMVKAIEDHIKAAGPFIPPL